MERPPRVDGPDRPRRSRAGRSLEESEPAATAAQVALVRAGPLATDASHRRAALALQRTAGNSATSGAIKPGDVAQRSPAVQRDLDSDILDALILDDHTRAVRLFDQLNDADLAARLAQQSPERLLGMQQAAQKANLTRVGQAIQNLRLGAGTQVANVEGTTFRTPVSVFQTGVVISKSIRFVKAGRFRTNDDFEALKNRVIDAVRQRLTNRFRLKIESPGGAQPGDGEFTIRVQIVDDPSASYRLNLHGQRHGRGAVGSSSGDIFELGQAGETETPTTYLAHECSHILLGAHDEYSEAGMPASRQVFTDHSLMGNFYGEGVNQAELKPRHFGALVRLVQGMFPGRSVSIIP